MKKEILTNQHIQNDLHRLMKLFRSLAIVQTVVSAVITAVMVAIAVAAVRYDMDSQIHLLAVSVCTIISLLALSLPIPNFRRYRHIRRVIRQQDFYVTTDRLLYTTTKVDGATPRSASYKRIPTHDTFYRLVFANFGTYGLVFAQYYTWAKEYTFSLQGVYNLAKANDTFYIVTCDHASPLMVYPTDYFEYNP